MSFSARSRMTFLEPRLHEAHGLLAAQRCGCRSTGSWNPGCTLHAGHIGSPPVAMTRSACILIAACLATLVTSPTAQARGKSSTTLTISARVPAGGDFSVVAFELSIGGEGIHHRKQHVHLELRNPKQKGVFALARLRPEPHYPGRFLGVLEVFHRASAKSAAQPSPPMALAPGPPLAPLARASGGSDYWDQYFIRAHNEHIIKETIKENIVTLAEARDLGPDDFCDPHDLTTYLRGNQIIGAAYLQAGEASELPTNSDLDQLADDAVHELCDEVEEEEDESEYVALAQLYHYLGSSSTPPPLFRIGLDGNWAFFGSEELTFVGSFTSLFLGPVDARRAISAIRVVLPPDGSTPRAVTNYICPDQLPTALITTTTAAHDTLMCSGGSLPLNQQFTLNVQTSPLPSSGMGGRLFAQQGTTTLPPFSFGGP